MSSKIISATLIGLNAELIEVEADAGGGELGSFSVVGLPDKAVSEARERVRSAIKNSGFSFPKLKVTINLAPAYLPKSGPGFDMPIAISILFMSGLFSEQELANSLFIGELALNGNIRSINGVLPIVIKAKESGIKTLYVPKENACEAKLIKDIKVIGVASLRDLVFHLQGKCRIPEISGHNINFDQNTKDDMRMVIGHSSAKRALEIAAAGNHNVLMFGSPGTGKSLLARSFPSILPNLTVKEALEVTMIHSVAGKLSEKHGLVTDRPFRSPHHSSSVPAIVGGGSKPCPGEITLAHRGVLFLDEFPEFPRQVIESLRQPLEDGIIAVSRAAASLIFPAKFILIAAMNPCPCGYLGDSSHPCRCTSSQIFNYQKKLSGPILDRIDIHIEVTKIPYSDLIKSDYSENSESIRKRVSLARSRQEERLQSFGIITNSEMNLDGIKKFCIMDQNAKSLIETASQQLNLSSRAYFKTLKLAKTIADLEADNIIRSEHMAEALQYRQKNSAE